MFDNGINNYEMFHIFRIGGSNISIRFLKKIGICYKKIISFSIFWEQTITSEFFFNFAENINRTKASGYPLSQMVEFLHLNMYRVSCLFWVLLL